MKLRIRPFELTRVIALTALLVGASSQAQSSAPTASDLIRLLNHETDYQQNKAPTTGCGAVSGDRHVAESLARIGKDALPDINRALNPQGGSNSLGRPLSPAYWVPVALAKIEGADAFPQLRAMLVRREFQDLDRALDDAIALSLGITSYVSASLEAAPTFEGGRAGEPRLTLNRLVLGWERNDRAMMESSLGPRARAALSSMLRTTSWEGLRTRLGTGAPRQNAAVGYLLRTHGRWAEPYEPLEETRREVTADRLNPVIGVRLIDSSGRGCGTYLVDFINAPTLGDLGYLVNNANIGDLLRLIGSCAGR